jgi:hypothetical protein
VAPLPLALRLLQITGFFKPQGSLYAHVIWMIFNSRCFLTNLLSASFSSSPAASLPDTRTVLFVFTGQYNYNLKQEIQIQIQEIHIQIQIRIQVLDYNRNGSS